ncbi:MAG: hypothetical protein KDA75_06880 [Planctomycetaceae bacterium]|nr:hypothetical protein [Planctomycetaceae bacterium]
MSDAPTPSRAADRFLTGLNQPAPRSRLATVLSTLLTLLLLALCGLCGIGLYYFRPQVDDDLVRVNVVKAEMLSLNVPDEFEPRGTIEWDFFWLVLMRGVYYELPAGDGMLMLLQVDSRLMDETDVREHVERTLQEKGGGGLPLTIISSQDRTEMINGQPVVFRERVGESPSDKSRYRLIEGVVDGNAGKVLIAFRIAEDVWEERQELVERTILSVR